MLLQVWLRSEHKFILMQRRILMYSHLFNNNHHYMISVNIRLTATILTIFDFYFFLLVVLSFTKREILSWSKVSGIYLIQVASALKRKLLILVLDFFKFACVLTPFLLHQENSSLLFALSSSKACWFSSFLYPSH